MAGRRARRCDPTSQGAPRASRREQQHAQVVLSPLDRQANGADGWNSTNAYVSPNRIAPQSANDVLIGASLAYPACLSFQLFFGLRFSVAVPSVDVLSARELDVLYELLAVLTLSGEYLSEVDGSAHLLVELGLSGFAEARSQMAIGSSSTGDLEAAKLPGAPDTLTQAARTSAGDLRQAPEEGRAYPPRAVAPRFLRG
jgi:hypothetical protein